MTYDEGWEDFYWLDQRIADAEFAAGRTLHEDGCPLKKPWLYDPDEHPLECRCDEIAADRDNDDEDDRPCTWCGGEDGCKGGCLL